MIKPLILTSTLHLLSFSFSLFSLPGTHPSSHRRLAPSSARQVSTRAQTPPRRAAAVPRLRAAAPDATDAAAALMVTRAEAEDFAEARSLWAQLLHSSAAPCLPAVAPRLLPVFARLGRFDEILLAVRELSARDRGAARALYPLAVSCLGAAGELARMEDAVLEIRRLGLRVDSSTGDAFVRAYAAAGTIPQMEAAYRRHRSTSAPSRPRTSPDRSTTGSARSRRTPASAGATSATCSGTSTSSPSRPTSR